MSKIAFVFPGQGTQYVGMGKELYENNEHAKVEFENIFNVVGPDLKEIIFNGPEETLKMTKHTQPAIVAFSLILAKLLISKGTKPDFVAGHSLGEYSAVGVAGFLSFEETVKLAKERGEIMNDTSETTGGTMAAVMGIESSKIEAVLSGISGIVEAVNYNEPLQTVISGEKQSIEEASVALKEAGAKRVIQLAVSGAFHSTLMKPAAEKLAAKFDSYNFLNSNISLIANTDTKLINNKDEIKDELYRQTFGPVKWVETIRKLKELGVTKIFEVGPGKVLNGLIKKIDKEIEVINIEKAEDLLKI